jgi:hypothetical protein
MSSTSISRFVPFTNLVGNRTEQRPPAAPKTQPLVAASGLTAGARVATRSINASALTMLPSVTVNQGSANSSHGLGAPAARNAAAVQEWNALLDANPNAPAPASWMAADPLPSPWAEMLGPPPQPVQPANNNDVSEIAAGVKSITQMKEYLLRKKELWSSYAAMHQHPH